MLKGIIIGNLGQDAGLKQIDTANGPMSVCGFSVACENGRGNNKETTWVKCDIFGRRADALAQYLTKGTKVYVQGDIKHRTWVTQQNETRVEVEINVDEVELLGGGQPGQGQQQQYQGQGQGQPQQQQYQQPPPQQQQYQQPPAQQQQPPQGQYQQQPLPGQQPGVQNAGPPQYQTTGDDVPF